MNDLVHLISMPDRLVRFSGADHREWLQGQISNDIQMVSETAELEACFCSPTGHIVAPARIWLSDEGTFVSVPFEALAAVLERVERFVIMEDCTAEVLPFHLYHCLTLNQEGISEVHFRFPARRFSTIGEDIWSESEVVAAHSDSMEYERIKAGVPRFGKDIREKTLLPELGRAFTSRNVSPHKGCYVGQEVIHRIEAQGHTNRTWTRIESQTKLDEGNTISTSDGASVGTVTSSAELNGKHIACGFIRNQALDSGEPIFCEGTLISAIEFANS